MAAGEISFAGTNLNDGVAYKVTGPLGISAASPDLLRASLARREGSIVMQRRYPEQMIRLSGHVLGATKATRESNLDALDLVLGNGRQILKTGWADERYYLAERSDFRVVRQHGTLDIGFEVDFVLADPFAYGAVQSVSDLSASAQVSGNHRRKTFNVTPGGTMYAYPAITLVISDVGTVTTSIWIVCATLADTPTLTITHPTYLAGQTMLIDPREQSVTINGVAVDYSGSFPRLDPRAGTTNSIEIHSTSTSNPTFAVGVDWTRRYASA